MAYVPDDLRDVSTPDTDKDYFKIVITDLNLLTTYPLQFRWQYEDKSYSDWSATYNVTTSSETTPVPDLGPSDVVGGAGFIKITWNGKDNSGNVLTNIYGVDVYITGGTFGDGTKPTTTFTGAGVKTVVADPGIYIVKLQSRSIYGNVSSFSLARTVTVTAIGEAIETPVAPTGFTARAILGGIEVSWDGTYAGGATWSGFNGVNIYAGTSATATPGTYIKVGQMTVNKASNKIVVAIDGTYVKYGSVAYIHASSLNKATPPAESSISANVASATPSRVVNTDLIDAIISEAKIALSAVTETKIANDAITTPKIVSGAITAAKIAALTITADQIAANTIDVGKLAANTISVGNLEAGDIKATSFIRAGTAGSARVEISSATVGSVLPGLTVYDSGGNTVLRAPLSGGLTITGALTATSISTSSGKFTVSTGGILTATDADFSGVIKATGGYIGSNNGSTGWNITANSITSTSSTSTVNLNGTNGSITLTGTDILGATQTVSISNGIVSISSTGTSFISGGAVTISGKNIANQNVSSSMGAAYFSLTDPAGQGIITMDGSGNMQLYTGASKAVRIGTGTGARVYLEGNIYATGSVIGGMSNGDGFNLTNPVFRNIAAGTGPKSTGATDGNTGDIWIQYA